MKGKDDTIGTISLFLLAIIFILWGIKMIATNLVAVGINSRTLFLSGFGGEYLILIGSIFLVVAYYSLSPLGRIRQFFEGSYKHRKKRYRANKNDKRII